MTVHMTLCRPEKLVLLMESTLVELMVLCLGYGMEQRSAPLQCVHMSMFALVRARAQGYLMRVLYQWSCLEPVSGLH